MLAFILFFPDISNEVKKRALVINRVSLEMIPAMLFLIGFAMHSDTKHSKKEIKAQIYFIKFVLGYENILFQEEM